MGRRNCWEIKQCGREVNGRRVSELGVCPAATDESCDSLNGGRNGGRICWAVAGTLCGSQVQGSYAEKRLTCMSCDIYTLVREEEGPERFRILKPGQEYKPRFQNSATPVTQGRR